MSTEDKIKLITRGTEEILTKENLREYLEKGIKLRHYIGFELSGKMHLGTGLMSMYKVKDFIEAGIETTIFLADWHTWINDKLGGDKERIRGIGVDYFKEGFEACMKCVGGDPKDLNFLTGFDLYHHNDKYWETVIDISKNTTLSRMKRSVDITGRALGNSADFAKLIYPAMQVADIFIQERTIAHSGMDQRKAHVIARGVALQLDSNPLTDGKNKIKPIAIHHPLVLGLGKPPVWPIPEDNLRDLWVDMKMSKSKPDTCVFITDEPEEIQRKIDKSFCMEGEVDLNPVLDWARNLLFIKDGFELKIERPEKFGGNVMYKTYNDLEKDFKAKNLHPMDLKNSVAKEIIDLLELAREHFSKGRAKEIREEMESTVITR